MYGKLVIQVELKKYKTQYMKLHTVIKSIREDKKLTQEKLAESAKLTRGYISRLEAGAYADDSPSIKTLRRIAVGLNEPLELILEKAGITQDDYIKSASTPTLSPSSSMSRNILKANQPTWPSQTNGIMSPEIKWTKYLMRSKSRVILSYPSP